MKNKKSKIQMTPEIGASLTFLVLQNKRLQDILMNTMEDIIEAGGDGGFESVEISKRDFRKIFDLTEMLSNDIKDLKEVVNLDGE